MKVLVFYHGNCADGFGAAWVVRKFYKENYPEVEVEFISSVYQKTDPIEIVRQHSDVSEIYVVDFSFMPEQMEDLCNYAAVIHIDHHKSAIERMEGVEDPVLEKYYDIEHSGAMLTWMYLFNDDIPPMLLRHIERRDLWKQDHPEWEATRRIQANLFSYPYEFEVWDELMADSESVAGIIAQEESGAAIERKHFKDIKELLSIVTRPMLIGGLEMPVANLPYIHSSDAGHILASSAPSKCAACYWDTPEGRVFSLRSTDDGPDVSAIAKGYGGGGHAHAAGFKTDPRTAMSFELINRATTIPSADDLGEHPISVGANIWGQFFLDSVVPF